MNDPVSNIFNGTVLHKTKVSLVKCVNFSFKYQAVFMKARNILNEYYHIINENRPTINAIQTKESLKSNQV